MKATRSVGTMRRRSFLQQAGLAGVSLWSLGSTVRVVCGAAGKLSANDRPGIALIGCGGMGRGDAANASKYGDLLAVCDVDRAQAEAAAKKFAVNGKEPAIYSDFRKLLEREDIHVVLQATPDHWHTLVNLAAVRAGKDVYAEKPLTMTIEEGQRLVKVVRQHKAILQTGSQQRSSQLFRKACELVRNGRLGKLQKVTSYLPAGLVAGPFASQPVPASLNWDFWQGQAPEREYVPERCHRMFRYWLDYSGGTLTDWGAHHNDIARWALGEDGPVKVEGRTLSTPIAGGYNAPAEYEVKFTYGTGVAHEVGSTPADNIFGGVVKAEGQRNGVRFEGTEGWIWVTRGDIDASKDEILNDPLPENAVRLEASGDHMKNFFDAVRSRKDPICPVEVGHRSASICHLSVICLRLGHPLLWDPKAERFTGEGAAEANKYVSREQRKPYTYEMVS